MGPASDLNLNQVVAHGTEANVFPCLLFSNDELDPPVDTLEGRKGLGILHISPRLWTVSLQRVTDLCMSQSTRLCS